MGARAQVLIKETGVYLYTHWGSESIRDDVLESLNSVRGLNRANDPEYLARIIFEDLIKHDLGEETGYGIGTEMHTDLDTLIVVEGGQIVSGENA